MLKKWYKVFSNDIGIDLGTANTLVYLKGKGIVITEPSVVAVNRKTGQIVALGTEAKQMLGRTPPHIQAVQPLVDGVVSDFEVTEEMLAYLISRAEKISAKFFRPRVLVGVPSGITNVESRAVYDAARNAGAREVYIVEEPTAAAVGIKMPVHDPVGSMIVDIGGGTTDIAVISLGGIVQSKNLPIAGDKLNQDIMNYFRDEFKLIIGEKTAENIKISVGSAVPLSESLEMEVRGRDVITGLPRQITVNDADIREAILPSLLVIVESVKEVLENTPPEILGDVMHRGLVLVGGGALIRGMDRLIKIKTKMPVTIDDDPLTAVARGTGVILENIDKYKDILVDTNDELPPR